MRDRKVGTRKRKKGLMRQEFNSVSKGTKRENISLIGVGVGIKDSRFRYDI